MPVVTTKKTSGAALNGYAALHKAGVAPGLLKELVEAGVGVSLSAVGVKFYKDLGGGIHNLGSVPCTLATLQSLQKGTLSATQLAELKKDFTHAVAQAIASADVHVGTVSGALSMLPADAVPAADTLAGAVIEVGVAEPKAPAKPDAMWQEFDPNKMNSAPPAHLRVATKMYQPVRGTSSNSRYFVVGGNSDIRVAARYKSGTLSVRVEGDGFDKYLSSITKAGLGAGKGGSGKYASLHLSVDDEMIAAKALGAVLLGLGVPLSSPMPNIKRIQGMG